MKRVLLTLALVGAMAFSSGLADECPPRQTKKDPVATGYSIVGKPKVMVFGADGKQLKYKIEVLSVVGNQGAFDIQLSTHASKFMIGVQCSLPSETLRVQLNLPEETGLVVDKVIPELPAKKAGLEAHDILIRAGGAKLSRLDDLGKVIDKSGPKKIRLQLIRAGKPLAIEISPTKRKLWASAFMGDHNLDTFKGLVAKLKNLKGKDDMVWFRDLGGFQFAVETVRPGIVMSSNQVTQSVRPGVSHEDDMDARLERIEKTLELLQQELKALRKGK